jgi:amphi-Trp domain-containing protein
MYQKERGIFFMLRRNKKSERDVEKGYPAKQFVAKLRRLADCIEQGEMFRIQVAGERVTVPPDAIINIEHEREEGIEEIEFQIKWPILKK